MASYLDARRLEELQSPWQSSARDWLGECEWHGDVAWERPTLGIISSHLQQSAFATQRWQIRLDAALRFAKRQRYAVLFAGGTPYAKAIDTAVRKLSIPSIEINVVAEFQPASRKSDPCHDRHLQIHCIRKTKSDDAALEELPFSDRAVVSLACQLFVIELKERGKVAQLLERRLADTRYPTGSILLALPKRELPTRQRDRNIGWLDRGLVGWFCEHPESGLVGHHSAHRTGCEDGWNGNGITSAPIAPIFSWSHWNPECGNYLVHCTRARKGPWPDQSIDQFHDEVFQNPWTGEPTPMDTLVRILKTKRLLATSALKPHRIASVSFSECGLRELLGGRTFESHLARWDWEPYGLMIHRSWLMDRGCGQVTYRTRDEMKGLDDSILALSQVYDSSGKGRDWRVEREWRAFEDVRLHDLPFSLGCVFVPTIAEARSIQSLSRWPICVTHSL
jgi:hypothetical protein